MDRGHRFRDGWQVRHAVPPLRAIPSGGTRSWGTQLVFDGLWPGYDLFAGVSSQHSSHWQG